MVDLLDDRTNLLLLREICRGSGLEINLTYLSRRFKKHRNTIRERVRNLLSHEVVDRPVVPFRALFRERPLLVAAYADLPENDEKISKWIREDANIFGAYRIREGEYNMMLFEFHKDVWSYHAWRDALVSRGKIPDRRIRAPSSALYLPNRLIKYRPNAAIGLIEEDFAKTGKIEINGYVLDKLAVNVLRDLLDGRGVRVNENYLSEKIGIHRSTIKRRISKMQDDAIISHPLCRFPLFFTPSNYLLVFSMLEVSGPRKFLHDIANDPHVSLAYSISEGRFNVLLFEAHKDIESYLRWESSYENKYPGCLSSIKNTYLSPRMTISIDQQKVSLGIISEKLENLTLKSSGS
jgi:DNA-binding Lrp family transcriptional regulator